ncbi:FMN-binding negative transcriptional regulator [Paraburkholderia caffeinilytica]|uniref:FMN-binding negative transcriptional regulator n=1 Tax=Paraburkholderia caffeinilytica TaxID=1761016 RepID=UPI0038BA31C0
MYVPTHFDEPRTEVLHTLITENPLGILFTHGKSGLDANHIPFDLKADEGACGVLHAHVARANPVWQDVANGDEVLVVFRAGDAYISPTWYPSKHEFHKQVPTWNYRVVHAHGRVTIRDDERYVRGLVARLTRTHEASQPQPWKMTDSASDYIDTLLKAIVGVEIEITRLVGKVKLSQNKEVRDIQGAGTALNERGENVIGEAMLECAAIKGAAKANDSPV